MPDTITAQPSLGFDVPAGECLAAEDLPAALRRFTLNGTATVEQQVGGLPYFINEFWTASQRRGHSLHEISYRACFKAELPDFFITRLSRPGEGVYDPFSGRGTTALQAALAGRRPVANDINPLSEMLLQPRLDPPPLSAVAARLSAIDLRVATVLDSNEPLLTFYHPETLAQIHALRRYLSVRMQSGGIDPVDAWIRMVAINRLTGHSPGFFSVYTLPPNQATSVEAQRKINAARNQTPPRRDVASIILKKSRSLVRDGPPPPHPTPRLFTGAAHATPALADRSVDLLVTSPPFLDVVDYEGDNWLRCWFAGIDPRAIRIDRHRGVAAWEQFVRASFTEFARVLRPGACVAFEVGEVRRGEILLERNVVAAISGLPFDVLGVMVNQQDFTENGELLGGQQQPRRHQQQPDRTRSALRDLIAPSSRA